LPWKPSRRIGQPPRSHRCSAFTRPKVGGWKKQALAGLPDVFGSGREQIRQQPDAEKDELYKQIGQMKVELDFLKKRAGLID
jgi:hypothetical protein